ncbi:PepSY domain-containing protein [Pelagerythrobacter sp.]|uniref:PepSY domain-containing protein n=1 Tax=Pelagerythrobacter sp. TaxID=2800702 RepID=UPI0035B01871
MMRRLARWHIWLGWLIGVPLIGWTLTGLVMVARPIEQVRGEHLRIEAAPQPLSLPGEAFGSVEGPIREMRATMQAGRAVAVLTMMDGSVRRRDMATGEPIAPLDAAAARSVAARGIVDGERVESVRFFGADAPPFDFRRPLPVWQVALADGTHVYVGRDSGEIEAVRTRWWRVFDFMWGLHIMDLQEREDTSHPILILFAAIALIGTVMGSALLFRRRKARVRT